MTNKELAQKLLDLLGGKDNVLANAACMTRLRVTVKDAGNVDTEGIKALDGLERVDNRLLGLGLDHCGTSIHTKKKRGRNPTSFNYNFICKQTIPIAAETCKHSTNLQVSVRTASPQE